MVQSNSANGLSIVKCIGLLPEHGVIGKQCTERTTRRDVHWYKDHIQAEALSFSTSFPQTMYLLEKCSYQAFMFSLQGS